MINITNVSRTNNDLTTEFILRYRRFEDPDVDASYTQVTDTTMIGDIIYPDFKPQELSPGKYVVHGYYIVSGPASGSKIEVEVTADTDTEEDDTPLT